MSKLKTNKILKLIFLPFVLSSLIISCSTELITNDFPLVSPEQGFAEIQGNKSFTPQEAVEHGVFQGIVTSLLPDDKKGLKHQQFMVKITWPKYIGEIIKIAHNIDSAPYVPVRPGSIVEMKGDIISNASPKVLHWTHRAYDNSPHPDGYIRLNNEIYQ